jgi:hypothetical protein
MRSVKFGNLIICRHVFDNYAERFPSNRSWDFSKRDDRIEVARSIVARLNQSVQVQHDSQTIFVHEENGHFAAFPAEVGVNIKIVTCYPATAALVRKADNCR